MRFRHLVNPEKAPFPAQASSLVKAPSASSLLLALAPGRQAFPELFSVLGLGTADLFLLNLLWGSKICHYFLFPLKSFERPQLKQTRKAGLTLVKTVWKLSLLVERNSFGIKTRPSEVPTREIQEAYYSTASYKA